MIYKVFGSLRETSLKNVTEINYRIVDRKNIKITEAPARNNQKAGTTIVERP